MEGARDRHGCHVTFRESSLGIKGTFEGVLTTVESCVISDELYNTPFHVFGALWRCAYSSKK